MPKTHQTIDSQRPRLPESMGAYQTLSEEEQKRLGEEY